MICNQVSLLKTASLILSAFFSAFFFGIQWHIKKDKHILWLIHLEPQRLISPLCCTICCFTAFPCHNCWHKLGVCFHSLKVTWLIWSENLHLEFDVRMLIYKTGAWKSTVHDSSQKKIIFIFALFPHTEGGHVWLRPCGLGWWQLPFALWGQSMCCIWSIIKNKTRRQGSHWVESWE